MSASQLILDPLDSYNSHSCILSPYGSARSYYSKMKPRISLLTLGVSNLERAVAFYRDGLGFETPGIVGTEYEHGAVAFFDLENGLKLALWPRADLAHDSGLLEGRPSSTEFSLGHNVNSREEVDLVMQTARKAGAQIIKPAQDTFWEGMPATSLIPMVTFGKSRGIRSSLWQNPNRDAV